MTTTQTQTKAALGALSEWSYAWMIIVLLAGLTVGLLKKTSLSGPRQLRL